MSEKVKTVKEPKPSAAAGGGDDGFDFGSGFEKFASTNDG